MHVQAHVTIMPSPRFSSTSLSLILTAIATFAGGSLLAYAVWSIPVSYVVWVQTTRSNTSAPIAYVQLPSFIGPGFYAIVGIIIGIFFSVGFFALMTAIRASKAQRPESDR